MTKNQLSGRKMSPLLVLLAWAIVAVPWLWGFTQTLQNAMKLFQ